VGIDRYRTSLSLFVDRLDIVPFPPQENAMLVRATLFSLPIIAALLGCGCSPGNPYNTPADPSKEAAEIGAGAPLRKVAIGRKKVTKPPGGAALKDLKNLQPSD
jgi:hypothetical protein